MAQPRPGEVFSHYRIDAPVGAGGMGHVFLATDLNLSRQVALKVVSDSMVSGTDPQSDADFRRRFHHEAEALAQLDCDHVIRIYEHGEFEGTPFIATQYVAGGELGTLLRQRGSMPLDRAALVCAQIAEALAEAHDVGIVHRDVKTSNVLIRNPDAARLHAVLCDFGIAHTGEGGFTATGSVAGTWAYLAPERAKGAPATPASDLYSLGCLFWACLTGSAPYTGSDVEVAIAHVSAPVPQLAGDDAATAGLNQVLARLLAKEPAERYPNARAAQAALLELAQVAPLAGQPVQPRASPETGRRRPVNRFMLAGIAAVLVTALGASALVWQDRDKDRDPNGDTDRTGDPGAGATSPGDLPAPEHRRVRSDFDGDGRSDLGINVTKTPFQSLFLPSSGTAFGSSQQLSGVDTLPLYGDFDADGRADLAVFAIDDVSLSVDVTTASGTVEHAFPPIADHTVIPGPTGDFNGDGRTDLSIEQATQAVDPADRLYTFWVALSTGTGFEDPQRWMQDGSQPVKVVADLDGDGDDDAVTGITTFSGTQVVHLSDGTSFGTGKPLPQNLPVREMLPGDFDGDGSDELVRASTDHRQLLVYRYEDGNLVKSTWSYSYGRKRNHTIVVGDFDGDGLDDVASYVGKWDTVRFRVSISTGDMFDDPVKWATWTCGCRSKFSPLAAMLLV